jgi:hypothetical protein
MLPFALPLIYKGVLPLLAYALASNPVGSGRLALDTINSFRGVGTSNDPHREASSAERAIQLGLPIP